jgi:hypothetical protein
MGKNCSRTWWHWWVVKICMLSRLSLACISFLSLAVLATTVWQIFVGLSQVNDKKMSRVIDTIDIDTIDKWKSSTWWTRHGLLFCPPPQWYSQAWSFVISFIACAMCLSISTMELVKPLPIMLDKVPVSPLEQGRWCTQGNAIPWH